MHSNKWNTHEVMPSSHTSINRYNYGTMYEAYNK